MPMIHGIKLFYWKSGNPFSSLTDFTIMLEKNISKNTANWRYIPSPGHRYRSLMRGTIPKCNSDKFTMAIENGHLVRWCTEHQNWWLSSLQTVCLPAGISKYILIRKKFSCWTIWFIHPSGCSTPHIVKFRVGEVPHFLGHIRHFFIHKTTIYWWSAQISR